jgi:protein-tyrosine phosphatase
MTQAFSASFSAAGPLALSRGGGWVALGYPAVMKFWPRKAPAYQRRVLMVCTGNICRSPTAHGVLKNKLQALGLSERVEVDSAGTFAHRGSPPDPRTQGAAQKRGYDLSKLRGRALLDEDYERFDLLLAMDETHLDLMAKRCPEPLRGKLALLLDMAPRPDGLREVPDPYYGAPEGFEQVLDLIEPACEALARRLHRELLAV